MINYLIGDVVDMRSSFQGADTIHIRDLGKFPIWLANGNLPSWSKLFVDLFNFVFFRLINRVHIEINIAWKIFNFNFLSIQVNICCFRCNSSNVIHSLVEQSKHIFWNLVDVKSFKIGFEWDLSIVKSVLVKTFNFRLFSLLHIVHEGLLKLLSMLRIRRLNCELLRKDVTKLSSKSITTSCGFLLIVIVIWRCQKMAEHKFWDIHVMSLMDHHRDRLAVVPHGKFSFFRIDGHFDRSSSLVSLNIVRCVHKDLVKYFVKRRHIRYLFQLELHGARIDDPHLLCHSLGRSHICVRSMKYML